MKKYLMTGIAALAMIAGFTSCSSNDDAFDYEGNAALTVKTYQENFIKVFGKPAANQTWGFGKAVSSSRAAMTRAIQPSFNFPGDADDSKFLEKVPEGIELLPAGIGRANHYIDESYEGDLNVWGIGTAEGNWMDKSAGVLYVKGNCDFSNRSFYFGGDSEIYLVKGATLTLGVNNGSSNLQTNTMIYIAKGAKLIANGELMLNNGLHIYNHGTIETPKLSTNNNSVLYNVGTVTVTNRISVENERSVIVNDGVITATDLNTAGSGKFENNNKVTISGTTFVNSNSNTWVNNGDYHTGNFIYYAASDEVINNCKLTVDNDFGINLADNAGNGNFKMDAGSSVVTQNFYGGGNWTGTYAGTYCNAQGGPFYIYMGSGSVFKVLGTATMNASKENYGIYGPESGQYAVFQAKEIVMGKEKQGFEVTYGGNLAVVAETHFAQGHDGREDHPFIDFKGNAAIYQNGQKPSISIAATKCNPGFEGGSDKPMLRVFAEDLSATEESDFDFNDVVFDAEYVSASNVKVTILAAGGTLPLRLMENDNYEVHGALAAQNPTKANQAVAWDKEKKDWVTGLPIKTTTMINTEAERIYPEHPLYQAIDGLNAYTFNITNYTDWSNDLSEFSVQVRDRIKVEVDKGGWIELTAPVGEPACKVAVPIKKPWSLEKVSLGKNFARYCSDPSYTAWYLTNNN